MEQKMIYIDLESLILDFYSIKIKKSLKTYYLIISKGKIGNKGITSVAYEGLDYELCKKEFWAKVNEKKMQGYRPLSEVAPEINQIFSENSKEKKVFACEVCKKELDKRLYYKIDKYLRNETSIDSEENHPLKNKVACFECQNKHGVYKGKKNTDKESTNE